MPGASKLYKLYFVTDFNTHITISFLEKDRCNIDTIKYRHEDVDWWSYYLISKEAYEANQLSAALKGVFSHYFIAGSPGESKSFSAIKLVMSSYGELFNFLKLLMPVFGYDTITLESVK